MTRSLRRVVVPVTVLLIAGCAASSRRPAQVESMVEEPSENERSTNIDEGFETVSSALCERVTDDGELASYEPNPRNRRSLPCDVIRESFESAILEYQACYNVAVVIQPTLEGNLFVRFVISGDGSVTQAEVTDSTIDDALLERCVLRRIREVIYPAPDDGGCVVVSAPFRFRLPSRTRSGRNPPQER